MAKTEGAPAKSNKTHKTLRDKLRKKRTEQKLHRKEKSEKKQKYDRQQEREKYFSQRNSGKQEARQLRIKKIRRSIEKFINLYEDDLQDFYEMFDQFDKGGSIDIGELENKDLQKCLKKMFKYLPLRREKYEYSKLEGTRLTMAQFMRDKVAEAIEHYMQYGSQEEESQSSDEQKVDNKEKKEKKKTQKAEKMEEEEAQEVRLYKHEVQETPAEAGPSIPPEMRAQLAELFDKEVEARKAEAKKLEQQEQDDFGRILSMGKTRTEIKNAAKPQIDDSVPSHLMAEGSALIGQKMEVDEQDLAEYDPMHRPKKLVDIHKEMKNVQGVEEAHGGRKRRTFNRERDVLGEGAPMGMMRNSTFFDFKGRMTKPKGTNQFL